MKRLILANVTWNALFVLMALSEMSGLTQAHEALPWWAKWWWVIGLAAGNLVIHVFMARETIRKCREEGLLRTRIIRLSYNETMLKYVLREKERKIDDLQSVNKTPDASDPAPGPDRPGGP